MVNLLHKTHTVLLPITLFVCLFVVAVPANAQFQMNQLAGAYVDISPQYPKPGEQITATFKTSSLDIQSSQIVWKINGETVLHGYGEKKYAFVAGDAGTVFLLEVTAVPMSGASVGAKKIFSVNDVSFAWEAHTYTPPFFSGRSLVAPGADVTVVAFPVVFNNSGKLYDPSDLIFEWMVNGNSSSKISGKGKTAVVLKTERPFDEFKITLTIKDEYGETRLLRFFIIPTISPRIIFYKDNALLGIQYAHGLTGSVVLEGEEMTLVAEPYYTSAGTRVDKALEYQWDIDGQKLNVPGSVVLRPEGTGSGRAQILLSILNVDFMLQRFQQRLGIVFDSGVGRNSSANPVTSPL